MARDEELAGRWLPRLRELRGRIRTRLRERMAEQEPEENARVARDDDGGGDDDVGGDTIFGIDIEADGVLIDLCGGWAEEDGDSFVLVGEGVEPDGERRFGKGEPSARLLVDPIDGTRGLMFDKRSAWFLGSVAPDRGPGTRLSDTTVAVMGELPTTRQNLVDDLEATRGGGARRTRTDLGTGEEEDRPIRPSRATDLRHGFATVCAFFQGGRELLGRIDEEFIAAALGGWRHDKAEVYSDQYISSGGQLAELMLGRDRMVCDIRSLVHRALGYDTTLCSRPYDLATVLIAREAGVRVLDPTAADGTDFDAPLDTTTNCSFVAWANAELAETHHPLLVEVLERHGCAGR